MSTQEELYSRFLLQKEYLGIEKPINIKTPVVSVTVTTYQHSNYISNCLDGILMQKTNFEFEIIIGEDESTDGTREMCIKYADKYPDKIRLFQRDRKLSQYYENNKLVCRFNGIWNRMSSRGKYIAWCEGDDYWTDPYKLQKQVDYLEENPSCGLMYTDYDELNENNKVIENNKFKNNKTIKNTFDDFLINQWFLAPCTWVLRTSILKLIDNSLLENNVVGDFPLLLGFSKYSEIAYLNESTAVYRVLENSASHFGKTLKKEYEFWYGLYSIQLKFTTYFDVPENILRKIKEPFYTKYFVSICLFGNTRFRKEVFCYLNPKGLIPYKHKVFFILTKFKTIKKILFLHYK